MNNSKRRYKRVKACVRTNTGTKGRLDPMVPERAIRTSLCANARMDVDDYESALRATIENDDVVRYDGKLTLGTVDDLRAAIAEEAERDEPDGDKIGYLNTVVGRLKEAQSSPETNPESGATEGSA